MVRKMSCKIARHRHATHFNISLHFSDQPYLRGLLPRAELILNQQSPSDKDSGDGGGAHFGYAEKSFTPQTNGAYRSRGPVGRRRGGRLRLNRLRAAALRSTHHLGEAPEYDKLDVYSNDDGGSGRFRGVPAGGSPQMAAIFKSWIEPIKDQQIVSVSGGDQFRPTTSPSGTDSTALSWIGLNGIGFQQDG
jgi:hypothetical protein